MASVSGSSGTANNIYSALSAKNKGIGGLASGLDTDSLVEALTMGTRSKIAKQGQQKQLLNWKMAAYRSTASVLRSFQDKHFNLLASKTNISSNQFFNSFKGVSSSDKVSLVSSSTTASGSVTINSINETATAQVLKTASGQFKSELTGSATENLFGSSVQDYAGKQLTMTLDGVSKTIKLDSLNTDPPISNAQDFEQALQTLVDKSFGTRTYSQAEAEAKALANDPSLTGTNLEDAAKHIIETEKMSNIKVNVQTDAGTGKSSINLFSANSKIVIADDSALGFASGKSNRFNTSTTLGQMFIGSDGNSTLIGDTFKFKVNGVVFTAKSTDSISSVMTKITNSDAGVKVTYSNITDSFTFTSKTTGAGENLVLEDVENNFLNQFIGVRGGNQFTTSVSNTNKFVSDTAINPANFSALDPSYFDDKSFKLTVGNTVQTISLKIDQDLRDKIGTGIPPYTLQDAVVQTMNWQTNYYGAINPVKFSFDTDTNQFVAASNGTTAVKISDSNTDNSALSVLGFSEEQGSSKITLGYNKVITGSTPSPALSKSGVENFLKTIGDGHILTVTVTINGVQKELQVGVMEDTKNGSPLGTWSGLDPEEFIEKSLNASLQKQFGTTASKGVSFGIAEDGTVKLNVTDPDKLVSLSAGNSGYDAVNDTQYDDLFSRMGFSGSIVTNQASGQGTKLTDIAGIKASGSFVINDKEFFYGGSTGVNTVQDLMNMVNEYFVGERGSTNGKFMSFSEGKLTLSAKADELEFDDQNSGVLKSLFGHETYTTAAPDATKNDMTYGKNAEIVLDDGRVISSTTNTFNIDGIAFEVNSKTATGDIPIKISSNSDPTELMDKIKGFVEEYNTLIVALNKLVKEDKESGYEPLTDEQRAELSEDQIKAWETEAKKGLLRNDSTLRGIIDELRQTLFTKVEAAGVSPYDIGLTTKSLFSASSSSGIDYSNDGQIVVDEAKLRKAIEQNPDSVRLIFTDEKDGMAFKMKAIIEKATSTTSDPLKRGTLVSIAGTENNTGDNTSVLGKKIDTIDKYVSTLKLRLESEYNRYWKKFSALETAISNMSAQSSWLTQNAG